MNLRTQLKSNWRKIVFVLIFSALLLIVVMVLHIWKEVPISKLTRDPSSALGAPFYVGFISQMGIFFWSAAAAVCIFGAMVIPGRQEFMLIKQFLFCEGLLSLILGFDDLFLIHEHASVLLNIPEIVIFGIYGILAITFFIIHYEVIFNTDYVLLAMAFFFLASLF